eukprot:1049899-Alexandrium_andersonii.AAC.1
MLSDRLSYLPQQAGWTDGRLVPTNLSWARSLENTCQACPHARTSTHPNACPTKCPARMANTCIHSTVSYTHLTLPTICSV